MQRSLDEQRRIVARNLSVALCDRDKTQNELAEHFNVGKSTVSNWCTGLKKPRTETLVSIASWLDAPLEYLIESGVFVNWPAINADRKGIIQAMPLWQDENLDVLYMVPSKNPNLGKETDFANFVKDNVAFALQNSDGSWTVRQKYDSREDISPTPAITDDQIKAAFFNGADPTLTKEEQDAMWDEAKAFIDFKIQQRKRKENQ